MEVRNILYPDRLNLGELKINIAAVNKEGKEKEIQEILDFERKQLSSSRKIREAAGEIRLGDKDLDTEETAGEIGKPQTEEIASLLAEDLLANRRISLETIIELQNKDERIYNIKQNLLGKNNASNNFILRQGVVCRNYFLKRDSVQIVGIYVPTQILYAVIIFIHKKYLHPSYTQTRKEFERTFFHPQSGKAAKRVCRACIICSASSNPDKRQIGIGRDRTLKPERPRESMSMDILYFPKSSAGHTHGLLISDLFSMYLSFFPLKSKSSEEIAQALRQHFSTQGAPKYVYSDNDTAFRGSTETLFRLFNITHITSFPYTQKQNTVEASVRKFKNAFRACILENQIFKQTEWHVLYPLVICRINSMLSKYGLSREEVHFGYTIESALPIVTDIEFPTILEEDMQILSKKFKETIGRFLQKKKDNRNYYKKGKNFKFTENELVMRQVYAPNNLLSNTFSGPY
jgi:hypothetical protein